jgi:hypothetical protein
MGEAHCKLRSWSSRVICGCTTTRRCTRRAPARQVLPLFVRDPAIKAPPNRARFLAESLADLRGQPSSAAGP